MIGWAGRAFAAALALALALPSAAPARAAECAKPDDIRVSIFNALFGDMLTFIAHDAGMFEKHCLNATLVPINSGPAGLAQLQAGSLQFSDTSPDNMLVARSKGLPVKIVVGESTVVAISLVARKGLALPHEQAGYPAVMKDILGKRIGVYGIGSGSEYIVRALMRGAGLDPNGVTFVAVGPTPTGLAAIENGAVDVVVLLDPGQDMAEKLGYGHIIVDLRKGGVGPKDLAGLNGMYLVKAASDGYLAAHADISRRFVAAFQDAGRWVHDPANFPEVLKLMKARVPLGRVVPDADALFAKLVKDYIGYAATTVSRANVAAWNNFELESGNIKKPIGFLSGPVRRS
jgi:ABC-type nitrate/sulfonate/bicarbonate transport system substrate-binding protein